MNALYFILLFGVISNSARANWMVKFAEGIKEGIQETFQKADEKFTTGKDAKSKEVKDKLHKVLADLGEKVTEWHKDFSEKHGVEAKEMKQKAHQIWKKIKQHVFHKMFKKENNTKSGHPRIHRVEEHKALAWGQQQLLKAENIYTQLANEWAEKLKKKTATTEEEPVEEVDEPTPPGQEESLIKKLRESKGTGELIKNLPEKKADELVSVLFTKPEDKDTYDDGSYDRSKEEFDISKFGIKHPEKKAADFTNVMKKIEEKEKKFDEFENDWEKDLKKKEDDVRKEFEIVDEEKSILPDFIKVENVPGHHEQMGPMKSEFHFESEKEQDTKQQSTKAKSKHAKEDLQDLVSKVSKPENNQEPELYFHSEGDDKKQLEKEKSESTTTEEPIEVMLPFEKREELPEVETEELQEIDTEELPEIDTEELSKIETEELPEFEEKKLTKEPQNGDGYWKKLNDNEFLRKLIKEESAWSVLHSNLLKKLKVAEERVAVMRNKMSMKFDKEVPLEENAWIEE